MFASTLSGVRYSFSDSYFHKERGFTTMNAEQRKK